MGEGDFASRNSEAEVMEEGVNPFISLAPLVEGMHLSCRGDSAYQDGW